MHVSFVIEIESKDHFLS